MTELTIDMVEELSSTQKKKDGKRASGTGTPAAPSGKDGGEPSTNPLVRLLSQGGAKHAHGAHARSSEAAAGVQAPDDHAPDDESRTKKSGIEHGPRTSDADGACSSWTRVANEEFVGCLEACPTFCFHCAQDGAWEAASPVYCKSALIRCTAEGDGVARVDIDTGYRVRPGRIREANQFAMMANSILVIRGFTHIGPDGALRFSFATSRLDPATFETDLHAVLSCCEEAMRLFSLVSQGASPKRAFAIFLGAHDELDDFEFESAHDDADDD